MIVNDRLMFVFIAVPRTASRSIRKYLMSLNGSIAIGRHHNAEVPTEYRCFNLIAGVRNPYSRIWSHFNHRRSKIPTGNCSSIIESMSFHDYVRWLVDAQGARSAERVNQSKDPIDDPPILEFLGRPPDYAIEFELLPNSLYRVPGFERKHLPIMNRSICKNLPAPAFDQTIADLVWFRYKADFTYFNYKRKSWKRVV